jgi:hypothetical protein
LKATEQYSTQFYISANGDCKNEWKGFRDSCYLFVNDLLDWHDAQVKREFVVLFVLYHIHTFTIFG